MQINKICNIQPFPKQNYPKKIQQYQEKDRFSNLPQNLIFVIFIYYMNCETKQLNPSLAHLLQSFEDDKIPAVPLEFEYIPVEIISKEFTKLNSSHPYRVHYLGPRPLNSLMLHKRYGRGEEKDENMNSSLLKENNFKHYQVNLKKIINCNFTNERMQQNSHYRSAIFYRAFEGMNPTLPTQQQFLFNSVFQSGNLDCVIKVKPNQFDLFLRIDSNTRGHTAWYYFSIKNGSRLETVTINICNLSKPSTLYEQGMTPFVFSKKMWTDKQKGWSQNTQNCIFQQSRLRYDIVYEAVSLQSTFRLSFDYTFQYENDQVFFAYCIPYTYSELQSDLKLYQFSPYFTRSILCKTLTGLDLPLLHITNHTSNERRKKNIIITGRMHPCQTNSSFMLKGFIEYLLSQTKEAEQLRNSVNFFIVPMMNPDGVVLGNTRTSAAGKDLNREFLSKKKELYPEVFHIKNLTAKIQKKFGVFMYIDFHGHSRRKNTFLYGPNYTISHVQYYKCRIFPKLIQKQDPKFRFYSCSFNISQEKKTTARAVMLNQLKIPYSYTIQSSIGLYYNPIIMKTLPFLKQNWEQMGWNIAVGLFNFTLSMIQYQSYLKDRKNQREKQKQSKARIGNSSKLKEDDLQYFAKTKKGNIFLDLIQQLKTSPQPQKNIDEEVDSDDYDDKEDLENYKLIQFNNMVTKGVQRQKNPKKLRQAQDEEIDFDNFQIPNQQCQQMQFLQAFSNELSPGREKKMLRYPKNEDQSRKQRIRGQNSIIIKPAQIQVKKSVKVEMKPKTIESKDKSSKNFVAENKERYSLATKNLFPVEDKCQILALPKSIQVMRKSMKKGRLLINNLEQSRMKFLSLGARSDQKRQTFLRRQEKMPFLQIERNKFNTKSTSGGIHLTPQNIQLNDFRIRKSQSHFHEADVYMTLNGFELDNRALTITTFKHLK